MPLSGEGVLRLSLLWAQLLAKCVHVRLFVCVCIKLMTIKYTNTITNAKTHARTHGKSDK